MGSRGRRLPWWARTFPDKAANQTGEGGGARLFQAVSFPWNCEGRLEKNAICCVWKLQIHYILMLADFWYILKGCTIVARKRYQRHDFMQIA